MRSLRFRHAVQGPDHPEEAGRCQRGYFIESSVALHLPRPQRWTACAVTPTASTRSALSTTPSCWRPRTRPIRMAPRCPGRHVPMPRTLTGRAARQVPGWCWWTANRVVPERGGRSLLTFGERRSPTPPRAHSPTWSASGHLAGVVVEKIDGTPALLATGPATDALTAAGFAWHPRGACGCAEPCRTIVGCASRCSLPAWRTRCFRTRRSPRSARSSESATRWAFRWPDLLRPDARQHRLSARRRGTGTSSRRGVRNPGYDVIVAPSGSCRGSVRHQHAMVCPAPATRTCTARRGRRRPHLRVVRVAHRRPDVRDVGAYYPHTVTYHPTCHSLRMLRVGDKPLELLRHVRGLTLVDLPDGGPPAAVSAGRST